LRYDIKDIEEAKDYMAGQERRVVMMAGARLAKAVKPQVDAAAKRLAEAVVAMYEAYVPWWQAKQYLISEGSGLNGLFDSNIGDVLGAPTSKETPLADYLRGAVQSGHLKALPAALR
jgi:cephalosporin hydroxylase